MTTQLIQCYNCGELYASHLRPGSLDHNWLQCGKPVGCFGCLSDFTNHKSFQLRATNVVVEYSKEKFESEGYATFMTFNAGGFATFN